MILEIEKAYKKQVNFTILSLTVRFRRNVPRVRRIFYSNTENYNATSSVIYNLHDYKNGSSSVVKFHMQEFGYLRSLCIKLRVTHSLTQFMLTYCYMASCFKVHQRTSKTYSTLFDTFLKNLTSDSQVAGF